VGKSGAKADALIVNLSNMREHVLQILVCYVVGMIVGNLVFVPFFGANAIFTIFGGAFLGLPELALTILIFISFRRSILRHLMPWCVVAPFLITAVWIAVEWSGNYSTRGHDIYWYLSLRGTWDRAALAFSSASFASALFWYWNSRANAP
jgi:hypothetical protein